MQLNLEDLKKKSPIRVVNNMTFLLGTHGADVPNATIGYATHEVRGEVRVEFEVDEGHPPVVVMTSPYFLDVIDAIE